MKKTLTSQLLESQKDTQYWRGKFEVLNDEHYALKKRYDDKFANQYDQLKMNNQQIFDANLQLQEIIRWHINPETAKLPENNNQLRRNF